MDSELNDLLDKIRDNVRKSAESFIGETNNKELREQLRERIRCSYEELAKTLKDNFNYDIHVKITSAWEDMNYFNKIMSYIKRFIKNTSEDPRNTLNISVMFYPKFYIEPKIKE